LEREFERRRHAGERGGALRDGQRRLLRDVDERELELCGRRQRNRRLQADRAGDRGRDRRLRGRGGLRTGAAGVVATGEPEGWGRGLGGRRGKISLYTLMSPQNVIGSDREARSTQPDSLAGFPDAVATAFVVPGRKKRHDSGLGVA